MAVRRGKHERETGAKGAGEVKNDGDWAEKTSFGANSIFFLASR